MSSPDTTSATVLAEAITEKESETVGLAVRLAGVARPGDIILLSGDLGTGKTAFARGFVQELLRKTGAVEDVPSPTFTLVQTYDTALGPVWHADLYRLEDSAELDELGLLDAGADAVILVEWPERAGDLWPGHAFHLALERLAPTRRQFRLSRVDGRGDGHPFAAAMRRR